MASPTAPELLVIDRNMPEIKDAIASCISVHKFADELVGEEFLSRDQLGEILDNATLGPRDKARRLIDAVRAQVILKASRFNSFLGILEKQPTLKLLATHLKQDYGKPSV